MTANLTRSWGSARPAAQPAGLASSRGAIGRLLPALLMVISTLVPQEVRIEISGQAFYPPRLIAILLLPWLLHRLATRPFQLKVPDYFFLVAVLWMIISFTVWYGPGDGLARSVPLAFDVVLPFIIARTTIDNLTDLRRLLILCSPFFAIVGALMAVESITHVQFLKPFCAKIFGSLYNYANGEAIGASRDFIVVRMGLLRAAGPFSHPILAGVVMASLFPIYYGSGLRGWPRHLGMIAGLCAIFSVSSGAILALIVAFGIAYYDRLVQHVTFLSWNLMLLLLVTLGGIIQLASDGQLVSLLIRFTLDPSSGWYRQLIWEFGVKSVNKHPVFGIGLTDFDRLSWMVTSVDNHWLLLAIRHGYITPIALLTACIMGITGIGKRSKVSRNSDRTLLIGMNASLISLLLAGLTVAFFGGALTWLYFVIGACLSLSATAMPQQPTA